MSRFLKWWALCVGSGALLLAQTPPSAVNPVVKRIVDEISQERIAANLNRMRVATIRREKLRRVVFDHFHG